MPRFLFGCSFVRSFVRKRSQDSSFAKRPWIFSLRLRFPVAFVEHYLLSPASSGCTLWTLKVIDLLAILVRLTLLAHRDRPQ